MKMKEIREKETGHVQHELSEQQKQLFTLRTQSVTEKLEDPSQLRKARRMIARLKTVLRQRELEAAKTATAKQLTTK
jgi:large subunit ribosomal protein L29